MEEDDEEEDFEPCYACGAGLQGNTDPCTCVWWGQDGDDGEVCHKCGAGIRDDHAYPCTCHADDDV